MEDYSMLIKMINNLVGKQVAFSDSVTLGQASKAIEDLTAQLADKDYLIQQQADEIERLRRDVNKQHEKMIELAKKLPKRGQYVHGRELSREYIGDCLVSIDYEDWRCSVCGIVFEQWSIPKYNY